jgi:phosphonopyruvate decarboxylase
MIEPSEFIDALADNGFKILSGVPCSGIGSVFHMLEDTDWLRYVPAANESGALGIAVGSWLAGKKSAVICQDSGVGNMVDSLSSLNAPYSIATTLFVSMRGRAAGFLDEPQHNMMGLRTRAILELLSVQTEMLPDNTEELGRAFARTKAELVRQSHAYLINPDVFNNAESFQGRNDWTKYGRPVVREKAFVCERTGGKLVARKEALDILMQPFEKFPAIASTGYTCRDLFSDDRENYFYMTGSMGLAPSIGLGLSLNTEKPVIVLDGDGALLMNMGTCATIGREAPNNLVHILLDNGMYESTGGQSTSAVDFSEIARACGYRQVFKCEGTDALEEFGETVDPLEGPTFAHVKVSPSGGNVGMRPQIELSQNATRFRDFMAHC